MLCYSSYTNMKSSKKGGGESWLFGNQGNLGCTPESWLMCDFGHRKVALNYYPAPLCLLGFGTMDLVVSEPWAALCPGCPAELVIPRVQRKLSFRCGVAQANLGKPAEEEL